MLHAHCPSAAQTKGVLPRIGEPDDDNMRKVDIPSLAKLGTHVLEEKERGQPVPVEKCTQENVYNVFRDAELLPPVQCLDFGQLLKESAVEAAGRDIATQFVQLAEYCLREVRRKGHYSINLFEVVAILNARIPALVALVRAELDDGDPGTSAEEGEARQVGLLGDYLAWSEFSQTVLAVAVGSTLGEVPKFPSFCGELFFPRPGDDAVPPKDMVLAYAEAKEEFIAAKLLPDDDNCKTRAVRAVRSGACFGAAVHRVKALQIQLAHGNPGESADEDGKVAGFGLSFNIALPQDRPGATTRKPHPYEGDTAGPYFAPDATHDSNHGIGCRQKYGGLSSCTQISGLNLNSHEQNHSKKKKYLRMLNVMKFDRFAFMVTLINEIENEIINRRSLEHKVVKARGHPIARLGICQTELWFCGRCFCANPLLRSLDQFGRVRLSFLFHPASLV